MLSFTHIQQNVGLTRFGCCFFLYSEMHWTEIADLFRVVTKVFVTSIFKYRYFIIICIVVLVISL